MIFMLQGSFKTVELDGNGETKLKHIKGLAEINGDNQDLD